MSRLNSFTTHNSQVSPVSDMDFSSPSHIFKLDSTLKSIILTGTDGLEYRAYYLVEQNEPFNNFTYYVCQMGCIFSTNCFHKLKLHLYDHLALAANTNDEQTPDVIFLSSFQPNQMQSSELEDIHTNPNNAIFDLQSMFLIKCSKNDIRDTYLKTMQAKEEHACELCAYKSKNMFRLKLHQRMHHTETKKFRFSCDSCPHVTNSAKKFREHQVNHEDKSSQKGLFLKCRYCNYFHEQKSHLSYHERQHPQYQRFKRSRINYYKCQLCPYKAKLKSMLAKHSLNHALNAETIRRLGRAYVKCRYCEFYEKNLTITKHEKLHINFKYRTYEELQQEKRFKI